MTGEGDSKSRTGINRLTWVVDRLRSDGGCPWDREQTLESLKQYLIEESYEVIDAIDSNDPEHHMEELGDVLLQVALQSRIREEEGKFTFDDVANRVCEKLIRRHPHVFGDVKVSGSEQVLKNWEVIKRDERRDEDRSVVEGMPRHLPALQKAQRIQSRVSRVGFDWSDVKDVVSKVEEELDESKKAMADRDEVSFKEEIGDLLFAVVNLCRFRQVNAEEALEGTIVKFAARFREVERRIRSEGRELSDCTLAEMDHHWEAIKEERRSRGAEKKP